MLLDLERFRDHNFEQSYKISLTLYFNIELNILVISLIKCLTSTFIFHSYLLAPLLLHLNGTSSEHLDREDFLYKKTWLNRTLIPLLGHDGFRTPHFNLKFKTLNIWDHLFYSVQHPFFHPM